MQCAETWRGHDQFPIGAPRLQRLGNPRLQRTACRRSALLSSIASRPLSSADERPRGLDERLRIHLAAPHFQLRISGKSSPCSSM